MRYIPAPLRRLVLGRSGDRCEYCQLSQAGQEDTRFQSPEFENRYKSLAQDVAFFSLTNQAFGIFQQQKTLAQ